MSILEESYRLVLEDLEKEKHIQLVLSESLLDEIERRWEESLEHSRPSRIKLRPIFCVLENAKTLVDRFDRLFWKTLRCLQMDGESLVFALGCLHRQVLDRCERKGERPPSELISCLKHLLKHSDPEVVQWSLRTVERMGTMGLLLKEEVCNACPGFLESIVNPHKKASRQIAVLLEKRWSRL